MLKERQEKQAPSGRPLSGKKPTAGNDSGPAAQLLNLQRLAGNEAMVMFIQRRHATKPKKGEVDMEAETIEVSPERMDVLKLKRGVAQLAVGKEIDRYVDTVQQAHRQGLANFKAWYRAWEHAESEAGVGMAEWLCKFLLEAGLDIIFPEEELFIKSLKKIAEVVFEKAVEHLGEIPKGDINRFLDNVQAAEEAEITDLRGVHESFMSEHPDALDKAEIEFIEARDAGWPTTEKLPPKVLETLRESGIGLHGAAATTVFAERWLTVHVEGVMRQDEGFMQGTGGYGINTRAEIQALRQMQKTSGADNRERIFELEKSLNPFWRSIVDINAASAEWMHVKLGLDRDDAHDITRSRANVGPFSDPGELVTRKLMSQSDYNKIRTLLVAH